MKIILFVILFICLFISCIDREKSISRESVLEFRDTVFIQIDSVTSNIAQVNYWKSQSDSLEYLVLFNSRLPAIQFYNWKTRQLGFKIHLAKEGPNSIPNPSAVYVQSLDSIFVVSAYQYRLFQINGTGEVLNTISLLPLDVVFEANGTKPTRKTEDALFALPYARIGSPMFKKGDWLYMPCVTQIPFFTENKRLFERGKSLLGVNIRTSEIKFQLNYPTPYSIKNPYFPPQFTQAVLADIPGTDKIVASFPVDHNVQVYDIRADLQEEHPIQSAELKNIPPMKSLEMDYNMHSEHFMNTAYYEKIIFDPYRKIYIRTVRYPDKVNPYIVGEDNSKYRRRYTALVADDNFHLLSEVNLSENGITNMNFFYTAEALYFQFRETSEDEIAFRKVIYKAIQ